MAAAPKRNLFAYFSKTPAVHKTGSATSAAPVATTTPTKEQNATTCKRASPDGPTPTFSQPPLKNRKLEGGASPSGILATTSNGQFDTSKNHQNNEMSNTTAIGAAGSGDMDVIVDSHHPLEHSDSSNEGTLSGKNDLHTPIAPAGGSTFVAVMAGSSPSSSPAPSLSSSASALSIDGRSTKRSKSKRVLYDSDEEGNSDEETTTITTTPSKLSTAATSWSTLSNTSSCTSRSPAPAPAASVTPIKRDSPCGGASTITNGTSFGTHAFGAISADAFTPPQLSARVARAKDKMLAGAKAAAAPTAYNDKGKLMNANHAPWFIDPRDKNKKRPGDPDYDPTSLYIPPTEFANMTPGQAQYWKIKSKNFDVVLFFKMGKFYELFDLDADIGHRELDLLYMGTERPHVGFPEKAYNKYAEKMVHLGYKVGRVEQMETPAELAKRNESLGRGKQAAAMKSKVVEREMCSILSRGTLVDPELIGTSASTYLLAYCEEERPDGSASYGVCFVDTATADFCVGEFVDDKQRSRFRTLLAQVQPHELVWPRDAIGVISASIVRKELPHTVLPNPITPKLEFWTATTTMSELKKTNYFLKDGKEIWPPVLSELMANEQNLALSALGGTVWYLRRLLLDTELVSLARFGRYVPPADSHLVQLPLDDSVGEENKSQDPVYLILDGQSLTNLEILESEGGGVRGSLLHHLDACVTPFGKRLFKQWLTKPLASIHHIEQRLFACEDLMGNSDMLSQLRVELKKLPDLDRLLARIHANGIARDKRAVMYENVTTPKLNMFLAVLKGFEDSHKVLRVLDVARHKLKSARLNELTTIGAAFPDLSEPLDFFNHAFDHTAAKAKGQVIPNPGVDEDYDRIANRFTALESEFSAYLKEQQRRLDDRRITYFHRNNSKEKYQLEVAEDTLRRCGIPKDYQEMSAKKGYKRYHSDRIRELVEEEEELIAERDRLLGDIMRKLFAKFCDRYQMWLAAVQCLAELDCLCSLATFSANAQGEMCRPELVPPSANGGALLELRGAYHPAVASQWTGTSGPSISSGNSGTSQFIPNDTVIGCNDTQARFVLVTGPNMGGKSTLLRQTCIAVIIAQLGCYVPAKSCRLTPVDRIFTRVGAQDRILAGQSTFMVELQETATILSHATPQSLIILDELGRGTSTFDGTAIAFAVIQHISKKLGARCLFSTHYHMLTEELADDPTIAQFHMGVRMDPVTGQLTFLYRFQPGACPKSYGMNVAQLAGLPESVCKRASAMSELFEQTLASVHAHARRHAATGDHLFAAARLHYLKEVVAAALSNPTSSNMPAQLVPSPIAIAMLRQAHAKLAILPNKASDSSLSSSLSSSSSLATSSSSSPLGNQVSVV